MPSRSTIRRLACWSALILTAAMPLPALSAVTAAAVSVEMHGADGQALRTVNGTILKAGLVVPFASLQDAVTAEVHGRNGSWTADHVVAVNTKIGMALLDLPTIPDYSLVLPEDDAFMPDTRVLLAGGPDSRPDTATVSIYYTFALSDGVEFIAVSRGMAGAAPALDAAGRLLGITGDLGAGEDSVGYLVPVPSLRALVGSAGRAYPLGSMAVVHPPRFADGGSAVGMAFRGALLATAKRLDHARDLLSRGLKLDPGSADCHYWMGRILFAEGQYGRAAEEMRRAATSDPSFAGAWHMAGASYHQAGRYAEAESMYVKAIEVNPNSAGTWCNLWGTYFSERRYEKAVEAARRSIELDPSYQFGLAYINLAMTYHVMGRNEEAEQVYNHLRNANPDSAARLRTLLDGTQ